MRIQKYIVISTGLSRRQADKLVVEGRVQVDGKTAQIGQVVENPSTELKIDGKLVKILSLQPKTIVLNKKAGYVTTRSDPHNPKTIYDLLPHEFKTLFPVGRLDKDTEGLLILTNDGDLSYKLTHPKFVVEKEYFVVINGLLKPSQIKQIESGIKSLEITSLPAKVNVSKFFSDSTELFITLSEGQNREIKKIFANFGFKVTYLKRVRVGNFKLPDIPVGTYKELVESDIKDLLSSSRTM